MNRTAIILAAGQGKRMESDVAKQYLLLDGKPILYYSLKVFSESPEIDNMIVVTSPSEAEYVGKEIISKYNITKVRQIVAGGKERFHSVYNGLQAAAGCDYVLIHDGARPFPDSDMIARALDAAGQYQAAVVGMPVKDTVKIADHQGFIAQTPDRQLVWSVQTPQVFSYPLIMQAYQELMNREAELYHKGVTVTDDAMTVETFTETKVKLVQGSYRNIKITTPEDLKTAEILLCEPEKQKRI